MKIQWSEPCDPYEWKTDAGAIWVGHTRIAVWIVKGLERLERVRLWLRRALQEGAE